MMRCVACGTEMLLVRVAPDNTMISSGYERYTLQCLGCFEIEEHLVFNGAKSPPTPSPPLDGALDALEPSTEPQDMSGSSLSAPSLAERLRPR
jgi:hypothetical protein